MKNKYEITVKSFIWNFSVYDNILYNLAIIDELKIAKSCSKNPILYNKALAILYVSLIEAIIHDFAIRLANSTEHFPVSISSVVRIEIKKNVKNKEYKYSELVKILETYKLLGENSKLYEYLNRFGYLRNRIHLMNWRKNFESYEFDVFTDERISLAETMFIIIVEYIAKHYPRPWKHNG